MKYQKISLILMLGIISIFNNPLLISAHKVEISENVGATLHIEPNDNPRTKELTLVWFALTKQGGKVIPLSECACKLSLFATPGSANSKVQKNKPATLQPILEPLSTEGYQNIPSAKIIFPKIGRYNLELTGKPINGKDFKPFKLTFKITVIS